MTHSPTRAGWHLITSSFDTRLFSRSPLLATRRGIAAFALAVALARGTINPTSAAAASLYQVQAGDTLKSIAQAHQTSVAALAAANSLTNPNLIVVGQTLALGTPTTTVPPAANGTASCPGFGIDDQQVVRHDRVTCPLAPTPPASSAATSQVLKLTAPPAAPITSAAKPTTSTPPAANNPAIAAPASPTAKAVTSSATTATPLAPPYHSQFDGSAYAETNCGPTSLSMALGALGINVDQLTLRKLANVQLGTSDPNSGTTWASLIYAAQKEGASVIGPNLGQGASQRPWSIADLEAQLALGHPVILLTRYQDLPGNAASGFTSDHYILVYGVDGKGNLLYNDPAYRNNGGSHLTISPDALTKAWTNTSEGLVRTAIALWK
jgi:LysM repeat protein/uncharacterized protein YvpB